MTFIKSTIAVLRKDLLLEMRFRFAINTVIAFVAASTMIIFFSLGTGLIAPELYSGLLWIIIVFSAMASLARSFVAETESLTFDLLRLNTTGLPVYTGKLLFNFLFTFFVSVLAALLFALLTGGITKSIPILILVLLLGSLGLSSVSTLIASLVSRATRKGAVFSVLCLPLLLPLAVLLSDITRQAAIGADFSAVLQPLVSLISYCGVTITISVMLFEYVWTD